MTNVKKTGQGKLFNQTWLEVFTKTNPVVHVLLYGGASIFFATLNDIPLSFFVLSFVVGVIGWTFVEYALHRFLFHIKPSKFQYTIHGVHHEYPRDKERLMMPPLPGAILICLFYGVWWLFVGQNAAPAVMVGFLIGYLFYTFVHYMVHAFKPIKPFTFFWSYHLKHHNPQFENKAYGVSSPLWDWLLGTMPQ